jgi:hypothetical protein
MSTTGWVGTPRNGTGRKDCFVPAHVGTAEPSTMNLSSPSQLVASPVGYGNPKSTTTNYTVAPCEMNGRVSQFTRHISSAGNSLPQSSWGGPSTTLDNVNWNVQTNNVIGGVSYEGPQSHGQEVFEVLQDVPRGQPLDGDNGREGCEGTPDNYGQEYFFRY